VFAHLWESGEESRKRLWEQVARLAAVRAKEAVALAWETMIAHPGSADPVAASEFVENMAGRLAKDLDNEDDWGLNWQEGSAALAEIAETYRGRIEGGAGHSLARLAERWGRFDSPDDVLARLSLRLLQPVCVLDEEVFDEVVQEWSSGLLSDLRDPCRVWLAENFADGVSETGRTSVIQGISAVTQSTDVTEEQGKRYRSFMNALDGPGISTSETQGHLTAVLGVVEQQNQSPSSYLQRVFPALAPRVIQADPTTAARVLQTLFVSPRVQQFSWFAWLHGQMADHWTEDLGDPSAVFNIAAQVLPTEPANSRAPDLLRSMQRMVTRGLVTDDGAGQVLNAACQLWPHHQVAASQALLAFDQVPAPEMIAGLAVGTDLSDEEEKSILDTTWCHEASILNFDTDSAVARSVLSRPPQGPDGEPDAALRLWVDARANRKARLLRSLLSDPNLSDAHRKRVWLQTQREIQNLGGDFFLAILPDIFAVPDMPETNRAILSGSRVLSRLFPAQKDRNALAGVLLRSLAASASMEAKNGLADWMRDISGGAVLRNRTT